MKISSSYKKYPALALLLVFAYFCFLMLQITLRYIPYSTTASFLQIKQTEVETLPYYLPVFYTHVYTSIFILLAGFTQFSKFILRKYKRTHRIIGYLYVIVILIFAAPTGFIMGYHANGGFIAQFFFITLSILWWWVTFKALQTARNKDFKSHRQFMIRSFALTLSAITLRLWKVILVKLFHPNPMDVYIVISGLGWLPNLLVAEFFIIGKINSIKKLYLNKQNKIKPMNKLTTLMIAFCAFLFACKGDDKKQTGSTPELKQATDTMMPPEVHTELYGTYVGDFGENNELTVQEELIDPVKISIQITRITEKGVEGRSVVRGNDRPMKGQLTPVGGNYKFTMDEPGDDKHDGRFNFTMAGDSLVGTWESYDPTVKGPKKKFMLAKTPFQYNANLMLPERWDYIDWEKSKNVPELYKNEDGTVDTIVNEFYRKASDAVYKLNASKQKLTEKQLKNLKKLDLEIIRNTIFARHGYAFKSRGVRQFFNGVDWYIPVSADVQAVLSPLEKDNIALLKRLEKYAEDNYDTFGR